MDAHPSPRPHPIPTPTPPPQAPPTPPPPPTLHPPHPPRPPNPSRPNNMKHSNSQESCVACELNVYYVLFRLPCSVKSLGSSQRGKVRMPNLIILLARHCRKTSKLSKLNKKSQVQMLYAEQPASLDPASCSSAQASVMGKHRAANAKEPCYPSPLFYPFHHQRRGLQFGCAQSEYSVCSCSTLKSTLEPVLGGTFHMPVLQDVTSNLRPIRFRCPVASLVVCFQSARAVRESFWTFDIEMHGMVASRRQDSKLCVGSNT